MSTIKKNPYKEVDHPRDQKHPVDEMVEKKISPYLKEGIIVGIKALVRELGDKAHAWRELETLLTEYNQQRSIHFFNLGYEHGFTDGTRRAYRVLQKQESNPEYHKLIGAVQNVAFLCRISQAQKIAAFLEIAIGLLREKDETD